MTRRCAISGKTMQYGNNVSHAHNKTRRRFLPNLQEKRLLSEALGEMVKVKISAHAQRSIEHNGGLDAYLLKSSNRNLTDEALRIKSRIQKALKKRDKAA